MKLLLKAAKIFNSASAFHLQSKDILIEDGKIVGINDDIKDDSAKLVEAKDLMVSAGWFDAYAVVREPGSEHKDTLKTLSSSASLGGFTDLVGVSGSSPALYGKSQLELVKSLSRDLPTSLHLLATISDEKKGKEITELFELIEAGALGFSDGKQHITNPELLKRAMLYVKPYAKKIFSYAEDAALSNNGMVNESESTAALGLKVRPSIAELVAIKRNIDVAEYADSPIHLHAISTKESVKVIDQARKEGKQVSCDVNLANLLFNDEQVGGFDTNYKVLPVLRKEEDRAALVQAVKEGKINCVSSGHTPQDIESKSCEFDYAEFGMMTLEVFVPELVESLGFTIEEAVALVAERSRESFGIEVPEIKEGAEIPLTIFSREKWELEKGMIKSTSKNSPFIGKQYSLRCEGIVNKGQVVINHQ